MAMNLETVLKIRADVTGNDQVKGLGGSMGKLNENTKKTTTSFGKLKTATSGLTGVLASLGVSAVASQFGQAAITSQRLQTRINTLAGPLGETGELLAFAAEAAQKYGIGQNTATAAVADLFGRLRPAGISLDQIKTAFEGVQNAAASVGLSAADTDGVLLQLSQALGSGTLQGDEFRSVMERLPAVGQALAESLGVSVGELKKLGSDGKLTTDVVLNALDLLKDKEPPPPDAYKEFTAAVENLSIAFGEQLLPAFTPLVQLATSALNVFNQLPGPLKTIVAAVGGLAAALVILAPFVVPVTAGFTALAGLKIGATIAGWLPVLAGLAGTIKAIGLAIVGVLTGPVGIAILIGAVLAAVYIFRDEIGAFFVALGEQIAGFVGTLYDIFVQPFVDTFNEVVALISDAWATVSDLLLSPFSSFIESLRDEFITPLIDFLTGATDTLGGSWAALGEILAAPFKATLEFVDSNFVKPVLSTISSAVDSLKQFWGNLTEGLKRPFQDAFNFINDNFAEPVKGIIEAATIFVIDSWQAVQEGLTAPFTAAAEIIKGVLNSVIGSVENTINSVIKSVNSLIRGVNSIAGAVGLPAIRTIKTVNLPRFADGGVVNGPTMAIVGEGGQPEYIIPASKADGFAANWMSGIRGPAAIPRFAEGGMVAPSNANVSIQTGPVTQMNGSNYVTTQDMSAAVQAGVKQTLDLIRRDGNVRSSLGIA